jgi:hypothetical protein
VALGRARTLQPGAAWILGRHFLVAFSVRRVRLEPVHDQTGDFDLTLEVREVPDIGQDDTYVAP